jgi:hypothetical protein
MSSAYDITTDVSLEQIVEGGAIAVHPYPGYKTMRLITFMGKDVAAEVIQCDDETFVTMLIDNYNGATQRLIRKIQRTYPGEFSTSYVA